MHWRSITRRTCRWPNTPRCTWRTRWSASTSSASTTRRIAAAALALHRQLGDRLGEGRDLYELAVIEHYREGPQAGLPYVQAAIDVLEGIDATVELAVPTRPRRRCI